MNKLRFKPAYNPYTEPSMEIFSYHEGRVVNFELLSKSLFLRKSKVWDDGLKLETQECSDLKCCFQWDFQRIYR
jgi:hypothetical protein